MLRNIPKAITSAPNRVRYVMKGFVICGGSYVKPLTQLAKSVGKELGKVHVDMGKTACKVPAAVEYFDKVIASGRHGKKRKTAFC